MSRLTIDMTEQQHKSLKALAALQGKTIKQYTIERLFPDDATADQAWQELKTLLSERINEGLAGNVSTKTIGEILDEELADEARYA
ncbi:MAG: antitoxin [Betaproteobacteria bacterium]|nr:antitoxin [Betaproteobacteria bacterium]